MAATAAVLSTYELLESILLHLPPFSIARATRVSRTWHTLITRSNPIHDALVLAPVQKHSPSLSDPQHLGQIPVYASPYAPRYNKLIPYPSGHAHQSHGGHDYMGHYLNFGLEIAEHDWRLAKVWDEFATVPPCQAIALRILREQHYAVVYVRDGVRVRHLREACDGMVKCVGQYLGRESRVRAIVTGWVFELERKEIGSEWECGACGGEARWSHGPAEMVLWH
jgi:hypothetical protein